MFKRIGNKIMLVVGIVVSLGLTATVFFYTERQERSIIDEKQRSLRQLASSVHESLQAVMLTGNGDLAREIADHYKHVAEIDDFRIMRINGLEAFQDNQTIDAVNRRRGEEEFIPHETEREIEVVARDSAQLTEVVETGRPLVWYDREHAGGGQMTILFPMENLEKCQKCHGSEARLRGLVKISTSMAQAESDIADTRRQSIVVLLVSVTVILALTGGIIQRSIVRPLRRATHAMRRAAAGDLTHHVPVDGQDELSIMANSFNQMIGQLLHTYTGLQNEQDKLTTIILSAREGIVVTDHDNHVVLVNPAAEHLLDKSAERIVKEGFLNLIDDPAAMKAMLEHEVPGQTPKLIEVGSRSLSITAATIRTGEQALIGSAAVIRDVTEERAREEHLVVLSTTDALTGLYNRRFLDDNLAREIARARRYEQQLSVLLFDVDHFKRFNDEHGHDQGDRVLAKLADVARENLRDADLPCRYGGEEFLVILPNTDAAAAAMVAERLRERVAATRVDGLQVTISIGVTTYPCAGIEDADGLVAQADTALYQAKSLGRNRVEAAAA